MKISSSAYLGVELLVRLAARNADPPCTTETLARSIRRSVSYTEHLIAQLREAGLVKTKHGPGSGYYLTRPADRITVADVFRVFDEPRTLDGRAFPPQALTQSEIAELFGTDLLWKALNSYILLFLEGISLADIAPDTDGALPDHVGHDERGVGMSDSLDVMRWGLVPFWAKDIEVGFSNINAKAEGIEGKPAFREAFKRRRCLMPVGSDFGQFLPVLILELAGRRTCTI